ncbi:MAG: leucine--tRNA ligase, partial [Candidatus Aenigmatarchaeota archaeon]
IEKKWQEKWDKAKLFAVRKYPKKKYYVLEMFPYPSAAGLHMGHIRNYAMGDCVARYKRMRGFNILYPMGYDAFGLPAENAAISEKTHPKKYTENAIQGIKKNQKALGLSYDWTREIATCSPDYYRWNQWFFLQMYKRGLAYKKEAPVNWCPKCETVLANEQVEAGRCWRCESVVLEKELEQWFLATTKYADRLLAGLKKIDWPENVKKMQHNWIGRKEWIDIDYEIYGLGRKITVSTTRPDTNYGATFIVMAPEHPVLSREEGIVPKGYRKAVDDYIEVSKMKTEEERIEEGRKKTGVFTGLYCVNPLTKKKMPIWVTDFVMMSVGTGAVVGVPGHDMRDFEFAKEFDLPVVRVIVGPDGDRSEIKRKEQVFEGEGTAINSGFLNGLDTHRAIKKIMEHIEKKKWGRRTLRYRLRDWGVSRQRYWGTPIPIIYCDRCGMQPVPEKDLPVILPTDVKFTGEGNPLAASEKFVNTKCPKCKGKGKRETDTMDTFFDSSWYFLRYCSPKSKKMFDDKAVKYWMPVDQYIGGVEHAVMHLMYARFFTMVMKDIGLVNFNEPFHKLFNQGIVYKDGHKMSKSYGNVVTQEEMSKKYGIDTARVFLLFVASPESQLEWTDKGVQGAHRFLSRLFRLVSDNTKKMDFGRYEAGKVGDRILEARLASTVKGVTEQIEGFQFNLAVGSIMEFVNHLSEYAKGDVNGKLFGESVKTLVQLISPFAPHLAEEMWEKIGKKGLVSASEWPKAGKADKSADAMEAMINQLTADIEQVIRLSRMKPGKISLIVSPEWKYGFLKKLKKEMEKTRNIGEIIKSVMRDAKLRPYGKDISRLVPALAKNPDKIPEVLLGQRGEYALLQEVKGMLSEEFGCTVTVERAEKSKSSKAMHAMPGKPGIEVS